MVYFDGRSKRRICYYPARSRRSCLLQDGGAFAFTGSKTVTWLRVDADMPWHDKVVGLPNDTARFAFVKALCAAKIRGRSTFTAASLREQLGSHARALPALVAAGLIDEDGDMLTIHDFEDYQRRAGHAEVMQRSRARSRDGHTEVTETSPTRQDSTGRDVTSPPTPPRGTFLGMRPKSAPGSHDGQHGETCMVCFPPSEQKVRVVK